METYAHLMLPATPIEKATERALAVQFMGVTTLLFSDGTTHILTDGFFSRPSLARVVLGSVAPDGEAIRDGLARAKIKRLDAVLVLHSHYDHAMDAPLVAAQTGATIYGSESTANIARGLRLPDDRIQLVRSGNPIHIGRFTVTFIENRHFKWEGWLGKKLEGRIEAPLVPPASAFAYKEGKTYSILFQHGNKSILLHGSAGFKPGALRGIKAETILLGTGGAGKFTEENFRAYLEETTFAVGARLVLPIHWDNMFRSAIPQPMPESDFDASMRFLIDLSEKGRRYEVRLLPAWQPVSL